MYIGGAEKKKLLGRNNKDISLNTLEVHASAKQLFKYYLKM